MHASDLRRNMRQHRHSEVLANARDATRSDGYVAHEWLQLHFKDAPRDVQSEYVDFVVALIRRDAVPLWRQQSWMAWMGRLTQHHFETRQITDVYAACASMRSASCLRRAWAAVPSLQSWIDD